MTNDLIASDHPLTATQQQTLSALLDTLLPANDDGSMPSAGDLDFSAYLTDQAAEFIAPLVEIIDQFADDFSSLSLSERYPLVQAFSETQREAFDLLIHHTYTCYYQDDRALEGIGLAGGPPFPRGNTVTAGDLSLLDPVMRNSQTYRK